MKFRYQLTFFFLMTVGALYAQPQLSMDTSWRPIVGLNGPIDRAKFQADGKIIIGGEITRNGAKKVNRIMRFFPTGEMDESFNCNLNFGQYNFINSLGVDATGKIYVEYISENSGGNSSGNILSRINADGTVDASFSLSDTIYDFYKPKILADGRAYILGNYLTPTDNLFSLFRINSNGTIDHTFQCDTTNGYPTNFDVLQDGRILIAYYNKLILVSNSGQIDSSFQEASTEGIGYDEFTAHQFQDGKIILFGGIKKYNGALVTDQVIVNADGTYFTHLPITSASSLTIQSDDKILVVTYDGIRRFNEDGSEASYESNSYYDLTGIEVGPNNNILTFAYRNFSLFTSDGVLIRDLPSTSSNVNYYTSDILPLPNGKTLVSGYFTKYGTDDAKGILMLNADGTRDENFTVSVNNALSSGSSLELLEDSSVLVFTSTAGIDGVACHYGKIDKDGHLDAAFNLCEKVSGYIYCTAIPEKRLLVTGNFTQYDGVARKGFAAIDYNGNLDLTFNPTLPTAFHKIGVAKVLPSGKLIAVGYDTILNRSTILRLHADGSLDNSFHPFNHDSWPSISLQGDKFLLNSGRSMIRLNNDGSFDPSFVFADNLSVFQSSIKCHKVLDNNKILIGYERIYLLNPDGTVDLSFADEDGTLGFDAYFTKFSVKDNYVYGVGTYPLSLGYRTERITRLHFNPRSSNTIRGTIFTDNNSDCLPQPQETRLSSYIVKAEPGPFYTGTDASGNYALAVDTGTHSYTVTQQFNLFTSKVSENQCEESYNLSLTGSGKDTAAFDFADTVVVCGLPVVEIESSRHRRCFTGFTRIRYSNMGNADVYNAEVNVRYPEYVVPLSSTPTWTVKTGSELRYILPTLTAGASGYITLVDSVVCGNESIRGFTQCIKAIITPGSTCAPQNPGWDGSTIDVSGICESDKGKFRIANNGTGNMSDSLSYRVYFNDTLISESKFKLVGHTHFELDIVSEGKTIRVETDRVPYHPIVATPEAFVEACGGSLQSGFVISAGFVEEDPSIAYSCLPIVDSYDPNDKQSSISGAGEFHRIKPETELDYTIRFQNTGSDIAYTVIVADTLNENFDPASFIPGASSHPYTLQVAGKGKMVVRFVFNNINLPDSTSDQVGSNGFVKFRIRPLETTPLETTISNVAGIYFDYNSPVITNTVQHTISIQEESNLSLSGNVEVGQVTVGIRKPQRTKSFMLYPNPGIDVVNIQSLENFVGTFRLFSAMGTEMKSLELNSSITPIDVSRLPKGMYLYTITSDNGLEEGKLIVK